MIARILLHKRLPRPLGVFDYAIPSGANIHPGDLVEVPFRAGEAFGLVHSTLKATKKREQALKPVLTLLEPGYATPVQLKMLSWVADYFRASPSTVAKGMIPLPMKRKARQRRTLAPLPLEFTAPHKADEVLQVALRALERKDKLLTIYHFSSHIFWLYFELAQACIRQRKRLVILFPTIREAETLYVKIAEQYPESVALLTSEQSKGALAEGYAKARSGARVVLGTQFAALPPLPTIDAVILHNEESPFHAHAEQNPRMHLRRVAVQLARTAHAALILTTRSPSAATTLAQSFKQYRPLHLLPPYPKLPEVTILDMRQEKRRGNYRVLHDDLAEAIGEALGKKRQVFLVAFRKGYASATICQDCGHLFTCQRCSLPLRREKGMFVCPAGHGSFPLATVCPKCHGSRLREEAPGTQKLEEELKERFPEAHILRAAYDRAPRDEELAKASIVLGTFIPLWLPKMHLEVSAALFVDTLLSLPDYTADERAFQTLLTWHNSSWEAGAHALWSQTFLPQHPVLRAVATQDYTPWYRKLLEERQTYGYPPHTHLIRFAIQARTTGEAKQLATEGYALLKGKAEKGVQILPPVRSRTASSPSWVRYHFTCRSDFAPTHKAIQNLLRFLPSSWIVEVDPESLL